MNLSNGETQANLQNENVLDIDNDPFTVNSVSLSPNDFNDSMEKMLQIHFLFRTQIYDL